MGIETVISLYQQYFGRRCPRCRNGQSDPVPLHGADWPLAVSGILPRRCQKCESRFRVWMPPGAIVFLLWRSFLRASAR